MYQTFKILLKTRKIRKLAFLRKEKLSLCPYLCYITDLEIYEQLYWKHKFIEVDVLQPVPLKGNL